MILKSRMLFASLGVCLVTVALLCLARSDGPRYRAESFIIVNPYTNAVFTRFFEAQAIHAIPGLLRLEVAPLLSAPRSVSPGVTNGAGIRIVVVAPTAEAAHHAATNAATRLCVTVRELYGSTAEVADNTDRSRQFSYFHDSFEPRVIRLFKH